MKAVACLILNNLVLLSISLHVVQAFTTLLVPKQRPQTPQIMAKRIEVCVGKDCKRSGGGPRLEKLIQQVIAEEEEEAEGMSSSTTVERCDCQGECGYGPNIVVDNKLINNVRGRDAIVQALSQEA